MHLCALNEETYFSRNHVNRGPLYLFTLGFCSDSDMTGDCSVRFCRVFLQTDISQSVFTKNRFGIKICSHETTFTTQSLVWSQTFHVGRLEIEEKIRVGSSAQLKVALSQKILEKFYVSNINIPNHYLEQKI